MKRSGALVASMAAASATAIASPSSSPSSSPSPSSFPSKTPAFKEEAGSRKKEGDYHSSAKGSTSTEKFAPRFDGLRFIETLVTAHR